MRTEKLSLERGNGGENRTLPRINARFYVLFTSLGVKGNELHVTDQKICTRAVACLRGSRLQITSFAAVYYIWKNLINAINLNFRKWQMLQIINNFRAVAPQKMHTLMHEMRRFQQY